MGDGEWETLLCIDALTEHLGVQETPEDRTPKARKASAGASDLGSFFVIFFKKKYPLYDTVRAYH